MQFARGTCTESRSSQIISIVVNLVFKACCSSPCSRLTAEAWPAARTHIHEMEAPNHEATNSSLGMNGRVQPEVRRRWAAVADRTTAEAVWRTA